MQTKAQTFSSPIRTIRRPGTARSVLLRSWPTFMVAAAVYGGWIFGLLLIGRGIPWVGFPLLIVMTAWHASLQHECTHGHPTRYFRLDLWLGMPPLSLWLPFCRYRETHLAHHRDEHLTCPTEDPESWYVTAEAWRRMGPAQRGLRLVLQTLIGRLLLGPAWSILRFWRDEAAVLSAGKPKRLAAWGLHLALVTVVLILVWRLSGLPPWVYAACVVYPAVSLSLIRSFAEHRAGGEPNERTAMVLSRSLLSLLFLNNNLHLTHHRKPALPWYALPAAGRALGTAEQAATGMAGTHPGYRQLLGRHLLRPIDHPVHPSQR